MINNKTILITGGTGSFGQNFVQFLLKKFKLKKIIIYSRDEQKQFTMKNKLQKYGDRLRFFIGDVRDEDRLELATKNVDYLVHAAAMKHVPIAEYNPFEVIKTNVIGAQNIINVSLKNNIKRVLALSTDKASSPISIYGASKLVSDKLFVAANNYSGKNACIFSVVRYGNVLGSKGSILPIFLNHQTRGHIPITDIKMTRFNITIDQSVKFVIDCFKKMLGGEIFVPKMQSFKVVDMAKAISKKSKLKIIGIRPGEKLHEELISSYESFNTIEFKDYFVICSNSNIFKWNKKNYLNKKGGKSCPMNFNYNSLGNKDFLNIDELKKIISKEKRNIVL